MLKTERLDKTAYHELVKLLRRIENHIDTQDNINQLWQLCEQAKIDFACLQTIMQQCLLYEERTLQLLAASLQDVGNNTLNPQKIAFILCVNDENEFGETALYIQHLHIPYGMEAEIIPIRGASSMCQGYEQGRQLTEARYKIYLHQDVLVIYKNLLEELLALFQNPQVGMVGIAGCEQLPDSGIWWDGDGIHNFVAHAIEDRPIGVAGGPVPCCEVQAADGVFLATQYDIPWRADLFKSWHFYDVSICQEYRHQGYKVMLPRQEEPWIIHKTRHTKIEREYYRQQEIFLQHYYPFC